MKYRERWKRIRKVLQRLAFSLLFALMLGGFGISADIPVLQAAQKQEEMERELPTGGVDEPRVYRVDAAAAEHVPSYENRLSFFSRTTSVFEAGTGDYGYNRLSDDQKAFYMSLEISLRNFENSDTTEFTEAWGGRYTPFKVEYASKNLDDEQAGQVWTAFHSDHPWLFWLSGYMVSFDGSGEYLMPKVVDEYKNDLQRIKKIYTMIEGGVSDYLDAVSGIDNSYEKVRIIYDRIIRNVKYAYQSDGTTPETANWAHSIVGVFDPSHKSAVCEGYAKTFSFLMNILDIPNVYIVGATQSDGSGRHAWNAVSFDGGGSYYYMDATWDDIGKEDPDKPENLYIYFAMPKSVFEKRHFADGPESKYWQYDLPAVEDSMERTYFKTYGAYGTGDVDWSDQSAEEFIKQAGALSPEQGRLILLVDTDTYDKIKTSLGSFWYYAYSKEDGYKVIWAELPERFRVTTPAKALTLSPTEISMDMNGALKPLSATVSIGSVTQNSDDYIQVFSSDEKVVTVDVPFVKAKQDWSPAFIRLTGHSAGTATIYARSASGGATASCKVVVKPKVSPSSSPLPTPSNPPFSGTLSNPRVNSDGVTTWDCVYFGNYWQEDTNGDGKADKNDEKTPIKWRVLSVDGDDVFLLADQNLDCQKYNNDTDTDVTWETCTMRSWLNGYGAETNQDGKNYSDNNFLNNAFSISEQSAIRTTNVVNDDNPYYGTEGGNDTLDKVYLLSIDEVTNPAYGFSSDYSKYDEARRAKNTEYAEAQGVWTNTSEEYAGNGYWWLRSPGISSYYASDVDDNGYVYRHGHTVFDINVATRAALHLNLKVSPDTESSSSWSYAGTVASDGTENEVAAPSPSPTATAMPTKAPMATETPSASHPPVQRDLVNPTVSSDGVTTWDCVYFGNYWQEDTNGDGKADKNDEKTPIKWRVLSVDGDDVFLLADQNLDVQKYNDTDTDVTWETCTMRSWLNGYGAEVNQDGKDYSNNNFLDNAFSESEQSAIRITNVVNDDNHGTEGGNDTLDKVYLLSIDEVMNPAYGFRSEDYDYTDRTPTRTAVNTAYVAGGGEIQSNNMCIAESVDFWWLRSSGDDGNKYASHVWYDGDVPSRERVACSNMAVRPALHLNLKTLSDETFLSDWSYAGTVRVDATDEQDAVLKKYTGFVDGKERTLTLDKRYFDKPVAVIRGEGFGDFAWTDDDLLDAGIDKYGCVQVLTDDNMVYWWSYELDPDLAFMTYYVVPNPLESKGYLSEIESFVFEGTGSEAVIIGYKSLSGQIYPLPSFDKMKKIGGFDSPIQPSYVTGNQPKESATPMPSALSLPTSVPATPKPTNIPDISPTEHPEITPTTQPLPTVSPTQKPTEQPTFSPGDTSSPTESPTSPSEDTSSPTETPKPTSSPESSEQPPQTTLVPSVTAAPNPNEIGVPDNGIEKRLKKGDSFVAGNIKYRITKLKGKKGEAAVAGVKSKKSKSFVIPQKVKKEGVTFTVTSIQKNAFKGCKKAKTLTIKSTNIRGITKKALAGLVKRIRIKIPKTKTAQYWSVLRKLGYSKINW